MSEAAVRNKCGRQDSGAGISTSTGVLVQKLEYRVTPSDSYELVGAFEPAAKKCFASSLKDVCWGPALEEHKRFNPRTKKLQRGVDSRDEEGLRIP